VEPKSLPIWQVQSEIVESLRAAHRLVLVAPTGSGKSTQVPQMVLDAGLAGDKQIIVLQPRRVAARTVAARVAWERNVVLGEEVGYQVRFDDHTSLGTRICFITEGILLRWLQDDPTLANVGAILFDEFHERNLLSDVALALVKQLQAHKRPDLHLLVMSATLDAQPVKKYLDDCPICISEGRSYPVQVQYIDYKDERNITEQAADAVEKIINAHEPGDILVFMPGMAEINATIGALHSIRVSEKLLCIPLHGELTPDQQDLAFKPSDRRKVVVATNVAETSVTIDGVCSVVDSGLARVARYDAERGISTLHIEEISRASSDQRKGRAGRTAPGVCYRLWTESGHSNRPERNTPEIQRADMAEVVLLLHSLGIKHAAGFDWLDKPDPVAVERAEMLLHTLGALRPAASGNDDPDADHVQSDLTSIGRQMMRLPMHPRYSRMLVEAQKRGCVSAAALCAALVSGRDLLTRIGRDEKHIAENRELFEGSQDSDFFTLMRAYQFARKNGFNIDLCRRYGINARSAREIEQTYLQFVEICRRQKFHEISPDEAPPKTDDTSLQRCLMTGFIDQLCIRRDKGTLECDLNEGRTGTLMRESVVQQSSLFVVATIREVSGRTGHLTLLGMATHIKIEWLTETFPEQLLTKVEHLYDRGHKRVAAVKLVRFHDLVIHHEHQREVEPEASGRCLAEAARKNWFELPLFNHEIKQLINRVNLICNIQPELELKPFDEAAIIACLTEAFNGQTLAKEAQATNLKAAFLKHLPKGQWDWLNELAPATMPWGEGKPVKLQYVEDDDKNTEWPILPEVQVKITDCFTLKEHPRLSEGRIPVRLWVCAPDGKRLGSTIDWANFRAKEYPKLKPALQKKFSSLLWP